MRPLVIALMLFLGVPAFGAAFQQGSAALPRSSDISLSPPVMSNPASPETSADISLAAQVPTSPPASQPAQVPALQPTQAAAQPTQATKKSKRHGPSLFWYPVIFVGVAFLVIVTVR